MTDMHPHPLYGFSMTTAGKTDEQQNRIFLEGKKREVARDRWILFCIQEILYSLLKNSHKSLQIKHRMNEGTDPFYVLCPSTSLCQSSCIINNPFPVGGMGSDAHPTTVRPFSSFLDIDSHVNPTWFFWDGRNLPFDVRVDSLAVVPETQLEEARIVFDGSSTSLTSD